MHVCTIYGNYTQSYKTIEVSAILKGVQETTGCGIRACMKQQVLLNNDRFPHKCELGNSATYQDLIYSLLPFYQPPYLHFCISGSVYPTLMAALSHLTWYTQRSWHGLCNQPTNPLIGTTFPPQLLEQYCEPTDMLDGCYTLSSMTRLLSLPIPPFLLFPWSHLLIRFSASAEWGKHNYHTYVRWKSGDYKVIKEKKEENNCII